LDISITASMGHKYNPTRTFYGYVKHLRAISHEHVSFYSVQSFIFL